MERLEPLDRVAGSSSADRNWCERVRKKTFNMELDLPGRSTIVPEAIADPLGLHCHQESQGLLILLPVE